MAEVDHDHDALGLLRQRGHRLTPQRIEVVRVISSHEHYLTAEEIHALIVPHQPSLDIASVYRILQWLQRVEMVAPIATGDGKLRYEYHPHGNHHHHLVCQGCGTTIQIPEDMIAELKAELHQRYHFRVDAHLTLPGRCDQC